MATLTWDGVEVSTTGPTQRCILHPQRGVARAGRLLAIMGGSGAGKSTLLDVLSNTQSSTNLEVSGMVRVNGVPRTTSTFSKIAGYVQQSDVHEASATVREALTTSALLRLPYSMPRAEKDARVQEVIEELDLTTCADTLIGDETQGMKGISGGQRRRVSVATELIKRPSILFLDEPTSGLDSEMALSCMEALVKVARGGCTVVCTIHQPNSDITALFDDFLLLAGGHACYMGPWVAAVDFVTEAGFPCPQYRNPTDHFMSVARDLGKAEVLWTLQEKRGRLMPPGTHPEAAAAADRMEAAEGDVTVVLDGATPTAPVPATLAPWWYQTYVLSHRRWKHWVRNPNMLGAELLQYAVISLFVGLMYNGSFDVDDPAAAVTNRISCIWFSFAVMSFTPSYTAIISWDKERVLLKRELSQGAYSPTTSFLSRQLLLVPFEAAQCLLFVVIMYWFVGFQNDAAKFFAFFIALLLFQLMSEGLGMMAGIVTKHATFAIIVLTFILLLVLSFSGFLVSRIPVYFRWLNKASYTSFALAALTESELQGLTFGDGQGEVVSGMSLVPPAVLTRFSVWGNIGILAAQVAGMELVKLAALHIVYRLRML